MVSLLSLNPSRPKMIFLGYRSRYSIFGVSAVVALRQIWRFLFSYSFLIIHNSKINFTRLISIFLSILANFIAIFMRKAKLTVHCIWKAFGEIAGKKLGYRPNTPFLEYRPLLPGAKYGALSLRKKIALPRFWSLENGLKPLPVERKSIKSPQSAIQKKFFFQVSELDANEWPLIQNWSTLAG